MDTRQKPSGEGKKDGKKQRLSSALRDNLRRRKAAPRPKKAETQGEGQ